MDLRIRAWAPFQHRLHIFGKAQMPRIILMLRVVRRGQLVTRAVAIPAFNPAYRFAHNGKNIGFFTRLCASNGKTKSSIIS